MLLKAEKNKSLPSSYSDIEVGQLIPGVVQTMKSYFTIYLSYTRYLADFFIDNPSAVLDVGQTLVCKVMEKKDEDYQRNLTAKAVDNEDVR